MRVSDLQEVLAELPPDAPCRVVMDGMHTGENGPGCRFTDNALPELRRDAEGVWEIRFHDGQ